MATGRRITCANQSQLNRCDKRLAFAKNDVLSIAVEIFVTNILP